MRGRGMFMGTLETHCVTTPLYKAQGFNSYMAAARQLFPPPIWERIASHTPPEVRALLAVPPAASAWLPLATQHTFATSIVDLAYAGDAQRFAELAHQARLRDFSSIYRVFIRTLSPSFVISRCSRMWTQFHQGNGAMSTALTPNGVDVFLRDAALLPPWLVYGTLGAIQAALVLTRVRDISVTLVNHSPTHAHWSATWR